MRKNKDADANKRGIIGVQATSLIFKLALLFLATFLVYVIFKNNSFFANQDFGEITKVQQSPLPSQSSYDGSHNYKENYINQNLEIFIESGKYKGETLNLKHRSSTSNVYDTRFSKGDQVFLEEINKDLDGTLTAKLGDTKRDYINVTMLILMIGLFFIFASREGFFTILSLGLNLAGFYIMLLAYFRGMNILYMTLPMILTFGILLLLFMERDKNLLIANIVAMVLASLGTLALALLSISFAPEKIDYDYLNYLIHPYAPADAQLIFLSQLVIGASGAILDVVVTIVYAADELIKQGVSDAKSLFKSCQRVADTLVGSMLPVVFFTNIAASLPFFLLCMRNGFSVSTILHHNIFFEMSRFLVGSIGTVLAVPCAILSAIFFLSKRRQPK